MGKRTQTQAPPVAVDMYTFSQELYGKMDVHQRKYTKNVRNHSVTFVDAASGTGKTTLALLVGMELLAKGSVGKIVYMRFPDDRLLKQGFLPGTPEQKAEKLFGPFYDACTELDIGEKQLAEMFSNGLLQTTTDLGLRGTNMKDIYLIIDEAQNAKTIDDLHLALTRLHDSSKVVVIGHSGQQDNRKTETYTAAHLTPFQLYANHMSQKPWAAQCELLINYRGEISRWADQVWATLEGVACTG